MSHLLSNVDTQLDSILPADVEFATLRLLEVAFVALSQLYLSVLR